jgi:hypothetical protein
MLLTELLFQRVKELGAQGSVPLKPGYVSIVSRAVSLRALILAALYPGTDDAKLLVDTKLSNDAGGATRVGIGMLGRDGTPYRLLREIGAARQLHKFDPQQKRFSSLTQDDLEIASFLRVESELAQPDAYERFFVLGTNELPSVASLPSRASANLAAADLTQAAVLKAELEQTQKFEEAQDKLFKVQQRLLELGDQGVKLEAAERDFRDLDTQLQRSVFSPAQVRELTQRAQRAPAEQRKLSDQVAELQASQRKFEDEMPVEPSPLWMDPLLWGGLLGGLALDGLAFGLSKPWVALSALIPFGAAMVAGLRFIDAREQVVQARERAKRLGDRETAMKKTFADDQAPLKAALKTAGANQPEELLELFKHHDQVLLLRDDAKARLENLRAQPGLKEIAEERPKLIEAKAALEMTVSAQGFARPLGDIERDLRRAMGIITDPNPTQTQGSQRYDPAAAPRQLLELASTISAIPAAELWAQLAARLSTYLAALTDKRVVAARLDASGQLSAFAPDGRGGPYVQLPSPLRDLTYAALRLALLERVAKLKKLPVFVDDTFAVLELPKRGLVHKMLKSISAETQVLHRSAETPPPNLADQQVSLP